MNSVYDRLLRVSLNHLWTSLVDAGFPITTDTSNPDGNKPKNIEIYNTVIDIGLKGKRKELKPTLQKAANVAKTFLSDAKLNFDSLILLYMLNFRH